jgi:hypothetical protein
MGHNLTRLGHRGALGEKLPVLFKHLRSERQHRV